MTPEQAIYDTILEINNKQQTAKLQKYKRLTFENKNKLKFKPRRYNLSQSQKSEQFNQRRENDLNENIQFQNEQVIQKELRNWKSANTRISRKSKKQNKSQSPHKNQQSPEQLLKSQRLTESLQRLLDTAKKGVLGLKNIDHKQQVQNSFGQIQVQDNSCLPNICSSEKSSLEQMETAGWLNKDSLLKQKFKSSKLIDYHRKQPLFDDNSCEQSNSEIKPKFEQYLRNRSQELTEQIDFLPVKIQFSSKQKKEKVNFIRKNINLLRNQSQHKVIQKQKRPTACFNQVQDNTAENLLLNKDQNEQTYSLQQQFDQTVLTQLMYDQSQNDQRQHSFSFSDQMGENHHQSNSYLDQTQTTFPITSKTDEILQQSDIKQEDPQQKESQKIKIPKKIGQISLENLKIQLQQVPQSTRQLQTTRIKVSNKISNEKCLLHNTEAKQNYQKIHEELSQIKQEILQKECGLQMIETSATKYKNLVKLQRNHFDQIFRQIQNKKIQHTALELAGGQNGGQLKIMNQLVNDIVHLEKKLRFADEHWRKQTLVKYLTNLFELSCQRKFIKIQGLQKFIHMKKKCLKIKAFSGLVFWAQECKKIKLQRRKYDFFVKWRVWRKFQKFTLTQQNLRIRYRWIVARRQIRMLGAFFQELKKNVIMIRGLRCLKYIIDKKQKQKFIQILKEARKEQQLDNRLLLFKCYKALKQFKNPISRTFYQIKLKKKAFISLKKELKIQKFQTKQLNQFSNRVKVQYFYNWVFLYLKRQKINLNQNLKVREEIKNDQENEINKLTQEMKRINENKRQEKEQLQKQKQIIKQKDNQIKQLIKDLSQEKMQFSKQISDLECLQQKLAQQIGFHIQPVQTPRIIKPQSECSFSQYLLPEKLESQNSLLIPEEPTFQAGGLNLCFQQDINNNRFQQDQKIIRNLESDEIIISRLTDQGRYLDKNQKIIPQLTGRSLSTARDSELNMQYMKTEAKNQTKSGISLYSKQFPNSPSDQFEINKCREKSSSVLDIYSEQQVLSPPIKQQMNTIAESIHSRQSSKRIADYIKIQPARY